MIEKFYPDMTVDTIYDIQLDSLKDKNVKGIILDIDNTLVKSHVKIADNDVIKWVNTLKQNGFKVSIVSNGKKQRVDTFNEELGLFVVYEAIKPRKKGFLDAIGHMEVKPEETAIIGDQIFTDIYGGNRINAYTILVKPIAFREFFLIKFKRLLEVYVLWRYKKHKLR